MAFFCLILSHSNLWFVKAYPRETTKAFLDGHDSAFAFLGGVPRSIPYDNTTLAVTRILGDRFGRPGKGNDKAKVEAPVRTGTPIWYSRQSRWTSPCTSDTIVEFRVFAEVTDAV